MNRECNNMWEAIVKLADGRVSSAAQAHLEDCPDCQKRFAQLQQMKSAMALPQFSTPADLIIRAKLFMEPVRARMGLIRTSLQLSGARSASQDFQTVYGHEELELRVMYARVERGWEVMGRVPSIDFRVERGARPLIIDADGRFHFLTRTLDDSAFSLIGPARHLEVPSVVEAMDEPRNDS